MKSVHAWANDYAADTCKTYTCNICPAAPGRVCCVDIHTIDLSKLNSIDAHAFGFPCNDFSAVGEQMGFNGKFDPLGSYGINVLRMNQPQWFLVENVGGIRSANAGSAFKRVQEDMVNHGRKHGQAG